MITRLSFADRLALVMGTAAIVAALVLARVPKRALEGAPLCWSVVFFHRECAGCGLTRSFAAIGRGSLAEANDLNPLGPILFTWAAAVVAMRVAMIIAPRFRWWLEIDLALAGTVAICLVTRLVTFVRF